MLNVYGREISLTNCDTFTRSHLASEGVELAPVETGPQDPYQEEKEGGGSQAEVGGGQAVWERPGCEEEEGDKRGWCS